MGQNQDVISDLNVGTEHNGAMKNQPPTTGAIASEEAEDKDHKPASAGVAMSSSVKSRSMAEVAAYSGRCLSVLGCIRTPMIPSAAITVQG